MNSKRERILYLLAFTPAPPLAGIAAGWLVAYFFLPETWYPYTVLGGLLLGLMADVPVFQRIFNGPLPVPLHYGAGVILFYAFMLFGVFMGVPIFHVLLSLPEAFLAGSILVHSRADGKDLQAGIHRTALFSTGLLILVFAASAIIALASPSTPADLQGMAGESIEVTHSMILSVIFVGGIILLMINYLLARWLTRFFHRLLASV